MNKMTKIITQISTGLLVGGIANAQTTPTSPELVDALNGVFGKHAGARASHAKGVCVQGFFHPDTHQAQNVLASPLWQNNNAVPVTARFSIGGGNPKVSDKAKTVRGFALHIGSDLDLVLISAPVFMVSTPEEFIGFMAARNPDPITGKPDPEKIKAFNEATSSTKAQIKYLEETPVPASYAQSYYYGVNAFEFTNAKGHKSYGRWIFVPKSGSAGLTQEQLNNLDDNFLLPELSARLKQGPITFEVKLQLAKDGDNIKDPSIAWADSNPQVRMGEVEIKDLNNTCEPTMFNPALLPKGISMSEDPTLLVRTAAYGVSLGRRLSSQ